MVAPISSTRPTAASRRVRAEHPAISAASPATVSATVSAVVFDVGHVLYDWDPRFLYEKLIADPRRLDWFLRHVVTRDWHFQHDAGRPVVETTAELAAQFPAERALIEAYGPRWLETIPGPLPGMIELVERLAARGVPLYAITNFSAEFWPRFRATAPVFDLFADILVSGVEKLVKPDPAIFALAERRFGITPATSLFIDDNPANVAAAIGSGWLAHRFGNAHSLERLLNDYGLL